MAYVAIPDSELDPEEPILSTTIKQLRDNADLGGGAQFLSCYVTDTSNTNPTFTVIKPPQVSLTVSSILRNSAGDYTVTFNGSVDDDTHHLSAFVGSIGRNVSQSTTGVSTDVRFDIQTLAGTGDDPSHFFFQVFFAT